MSNLSRSEKDPAQTPPAYRNVYAQGGRKPKTMTTPTAAAPARYNHRADHRRAPAGGRSNGAAAARRCRNVPDFPTWPTPLKKAPAAGEATDAATTTRRAHCPRRRIQPGRRRHRRRPVDGRDSHSRRPRRADTRPIRRHGESLRRLLPRLRRQAEFAAMGRPRHRHGDLGRPTPRRQAQPGQFADVEAPRRKLLVSVKGWFGSRAATRAAKAAEAAQ